MVKVSNGIITTLNFVTLLVSIFAMLLALWFYVKAGSPCESFIRTPLLIIGGCLMAISMMGLLGSCCRVSFFMWLYLIALFFLILGLMVFTIFAVVVTNKSVGQALSGKKVGSAKLDDYTKWMQKYVINPSNWEKIKSCLVHAQMCQKSTEGKDKDFYLKKLPLSEAGCCKPPNVCGFEFKDSTTWLMPKTGPASPDPDCKIWSNDQSELCLNCESCKAVALDNIKKEWWILSIMNSCIIFLISLIYSIGCCALRNNQNHGYSAYKQQYY